MVKSKKTNSENVLNIRVGFSRSAIALAVAAVFSGQASASDGTTLPDSEGEFSVGSAGTGYDSEGTIPTYTKVGSNVGVVNLNTNAKAVLTWANLGVGTSQTLTFSDSHGDGSVVLNKMTGDNPSTFAGAVNASDNVDLIFVNPNGITVSTGASFGGVTDLLLSTNATSITNITGLSSFSSITDESLTGGTDLSISAPISVKAGGDIWLMADGTISAGTNKITAADLVIDADGAVSIDTAVTNADLSSTGAIDIADDDSLTITNLSASGTGTIDI
ncbi:MAG: filamentous hemagglutinin N-terminal domain-containing protein, partial [Oceanospirillaceae bacterium]|nr:filamentous hemagglutinin N-terminal domain-containing protein [Oceanospirillaceae bacterium]